MNLKSLWRRTSTWLHVFDLAVWFSYYIWFSSFLTVVKMKSKHTGIWIIHVKLNFFAEKKIFLGIREKRITGQIFYEEMKLLSYVLKIMFMFS